MRKHFNYTIYYITASRKGKNQEVKLLLELKPDVNIKDKHGWTPLHYGL